MHLIELGPHTEGNLAPTSHFDHIKFIVDDERYDFPVSLQVSRRVPTAQGKLGKWKTNIPVRENTGNLEMWSNLLFNSRKYLIEALLSFAKRCFEGCIFSLVKEVNNKVNFHFCNYDKYHVANT